MNKSVKRHRAPYVVRTLLSVSSLFLALWKSLNALLIPSILHLALSVIWIFFVEFRYDLVLRYPNNKLFRDFIDLLFITMFIYLTGGTFSFLIIASLAWTLGSSMNVRRLYGLFAAVASISLYGLMILFMALDILPPMNILDDGPASFNLLHSLLALTVLAVTIMVNHDFIFKLYRNLNSERHELEKRNALVEGEMQMARQIQMQIVPSRAPLENMAVLYRPMETLGGDFFDFMRFGDGKSLGIFICDVSGHGAAPSFITSMIKMFLLQSRDKQENPAVLFMYLNQILNRELFTTGNFVTAWYGVIDFENRRLTYSSAGHPSPFIVTGGDITRLDRTQGIPMAILTNAELAGKRKMYKDVRIDLPAEGKLLLYTDCLLETVRHDNTKIHFEDGGLAGALADAKSLGPEEFLRTIYERLVEFHGSPSLDDDISMICVDL